jgi:hypothetical protein
MYQLTEAQLYNLDNGRTYYEKPINLILHLTVSHLRNEHNMPLHVIAKRCNMKVKDIKKILLTDSAT